MQALLAGGSYPNSRSTLSGSTPLSLLCDNKDRWGQEFPGAVTILLSHGARLDSLPNNQGGELKELGFALEAVVDRWQVNSSVNGDVARITLQSFVEDEQNKEEESKTECQLCSMEYSFFKRQHHCRLCSSSCCDTCSKKHVLVDKKAVRTCDACFNMAFYRVNKSLQQSNRNSSAEIPTGTGSPNSRSPRASARPASPAQDQLVHQAKSELFQGSSSGKGSSSSGASGKGSGSSSPRGGKRGEEGSMGATKNALAEVGDRLRERGEKLAQLDDKSQELAAASSDFAMMAKQLNEQQKSRWF